MILSKDQISDALEQICDWNALELNIQKNSDSTDVLIPFVMNDAVECYYALKDCRVLGEWDQQIDEVTDFEVLAGNTSDGILFRKADGNVLTIWYREAKEELHCYQYHRIGHAWRKEPGEEHWRRIVNLLCVLHDKYTYLGMRACNEMEQKLAKLAEFAPIRYWTPINESIDDWYPDTEDGIDAMREIALEAQDDELLRLLKKYESIFQNEKKRKKIVKQIAFLLNMSEHQRIYRIISEQIEEASMLWEPRIYHEKMTEEIQSMREHAVELLQKEGYVGSYPAFRKTDEKTGLITETYLVEEHPFTVMESEEYHFRIFAIHTPYPWT